MKWRNFCALGRGHGAPPEARQWKIVPLIQTEYISGTLLISEVYDANKSHSTSPLFPIYVAAAVHRMFLKDNKANEYYLKLQN